MSTSHIFICQICSTQTKRLSTHIKHNHNITPQQYYDMYLKQPNEGICVNCGKLTNFHGITHGYSIYCSLKCANKYNVKKIKKSKLERYGSETYNNQAKAKQTCLERYGVDNVLKLSDVHKKGIEKAHSAESNKKRIKTCLTKYGAENIWSSDYGKQQIKETNLKRYGVEYISQNKDFITKVKLTNLQRYGVECNLNLDKVKQKLSTTEVQTKRANSLRNKPKYSKLEQYFEAQLNLLGYKKDIDYFVQYRSADYPFMCDFYLVKKDIYIEINGYWMHNTHPFNELSINDLAILNKWTKKANSSSQYKYAIYVWTKSDPEKRKYGQKLNYVELWNMNDIDNFIKNLKEEL